MKTFVALFRGLNVGRSNVLPMKQLVSLLEGLGVNRPRTYFQSGSGLLASSAVANTRIPSVEGKLRKALMFAAARSWAGHESRYAVIQPGRTI
jgi:uncharacterized protein (DUF1697 family)